MEVKDNGNARLQDLGMPSGEITEPEVKQIKANTGCTVQIYINKLTQARELKIYGSPCMVSVGYGQTLGMMFDSLVQQDDQEQDKVADKICDKYWKSCFNPKLDGTHTKTTLATATTARAMKAIAKTARASADDAPTPMTTARASKDDEPTPMTLARASKDDEPQAKAPMPPPKTPMPKKEKQHETDEGGNTQPPSEPQVIQLFEAIRLEKTKKDKPCWSSIEHALFASPKSSTNAQGPGQSHAKDSPLIIPRNPGGQTMAIPTLFGPTPTAQVFGPVPTFPFPFQPTKNLDLQQTLAILKPPPGLEHVMKGTNEKDACSWQ